MARRNTDASQGVGEKKNQKPVEAAMYLLFRDLETGTREDLKMFLGALPVGGGSLDSWSLHQLQALALAETNPLPLQIALTATMSFLIFFLLLSFRQP